MSHELFYTSLPRGLRPGSKDFCTVAQTTGIPASLAERLESLSGYRPLYPAASPQAKANPVSFAHWRISAAGHSWSVLSRVCFSGLDYTRRSNKFAHHLALTISELPPGGPAWVMSQSGVMESAWAGEPHEIAAGRQAPWGDRPPAVCDAWAAVAGDAGWAGTLAQAFQSDKAKPAYIIYQPGTDVLSLAVEALALLREDERWQVTFNTYYTDLPAGLTCAWRFCIAGSPVATEAKRASHGLLIDLTSRLPPPAPSEWVELARTGVSTDSATTNLLDENGLNDDEAIDFDLVNSVAAANDRPPNKITLTSNKAAPKARAKLGQITPVSVAAAASQSWMPPASATVVETLGGGGPVARSGVSMWLLLPLSMVFGIFGFGLGWALHQPTKLGGPNDSASAVQNGPSAVPSTPMASGAPPSPGENHPAQINTDNKDSAKYEAKKGHQPSGGSQPPNDQARGQEGQTASAPAKPPTTDSGGQKVSAPGDGQSSSKGQAGGAAQPAPADQPPASPLAALIPDTNSYSMDIMDKKRLSARGGFLSKFPHEATLKIIDPSPPNAIEDVHISQSPSSNTQCLNFRRPEGGSDQKWVDLFALTLTNDGLLLLDWSRLKGKDDDQCRKFLRSRVLEITEPGQKTEYVQFQNPSNDVEFQLNNPVPSSVPGIKQEVRLRSLQAMDGWTILGEMTPTLTIKHGSEENGKNPGLAFQISVTTQGASAQVRCSFFLDCWKPENGKLSNAKTERDNAKAALDGATAADNTDNLKAALKLKEDAYGAQVARVSLLEAFNGFKTALCLPNKIVVAKVIFKVKPNQG
jgi:hypothetical protein